MSSLRAADAPRRSLFAFHLELSRIPRRKPSSFVLRGAIGVLSSSTMPRGSNKRTELISCRTGFPHLQLAHAVCAFVVRDCRGLCDGLQHRRTHVAPPGDKSREAPCMPADDEEMNPIRRFHNRNAAIRIALVPFRKIAIVDLAVAMAARDRVKVVA